MEPPVRPSPPTTSVTYRDLTPEQKKRVENFKNNCLDRGLEVSISRDFTRLIITGSDKSKTMIRPLSDFLS